MRKRITVFCLVAVTAVITSRLASRRGDTPTPVTPASQGAQPPEKGLTAPRPRAGSSMPGSSAGVVTTNRSARRLTWWEMKAAGEPMRQRFKDEGAHEEIFVREADWREKFKGLKVGMTVPEAVAAMGEPPTHADALVVSGGAQEFVSVDTNPLPDIKSHAVLNYSPDGLAPMDGINGPRLDRLPFDFFALEFDGTGKLETMINMYDDPVARVREKVRANPELKESFAKQDEWSEKSKTLKGGMTIQEVAEVMGKPTHLEQMPSGLGGQTFFYYLPGGLAGYENMLSPFDNLMLIFDGDGKLAEINNKKLEK